MLGLTVIESETKESCFISLPILLKFTVKNQPAPSSRVASRVLFLSLLTHIFKFILIKFHFFFHFRFSLWIYYLFAFLSCYSVICKVVFFFLVLHSHFVIFLSFTCGGSVLPAGCILVLGSVQNIYDFCR